MKLFTAFTDKAPNTVFFSVLMGGLAGIAYAFLIPVVISTLSSNAAGVNYVQSANNSFASIKVANYELAVVFFMTCLFILLARTSSQVLLLRVATQVTTDLRKKMYQRISKAPIDKLERLGSSRLIATISQDVSRIVGGARLLPDILTNGATLLGMLGYLWYLNPAVFWFVMQTILIGVVTYQIPMYFGNRYFLRSRNSYDGLQEAIRGLIYGAKELKLNHEKKARYFDEVLLHHEYAVMNADMRGFSIINIAKNYGDMISFLVVGFVTFVFVNYHVITNAELVGVIMALLYLTGPIAIIVNFIPGLMQAKVSLRKVEALMEDLPEEQALTEISAIAPWQQLIFKGVTFKHADDGAEGGFALGPVDLTIERGQVTFIVGGNGSGKSTLSKLISLHYRANDGTICFDKQPVTDASLYGCRAEIGAIFSDYYLFDRLLGQTSVEQQAQIQHYLKLLNLDKKVSIHEGYFSTIALSDGQRRRLALLVAFLEDKAMYVFDEWAADQDPIFKDIFYRQLLPQLRAKGKAVVVISHDDRFFDVADKVLVMEDGQLVKVIVEQPDLVGKLFEKTVVDPQQKVFQMDLI